MSYLLVFKALFGSKLIFRMDREEFHFGAQGVEFAFKNSSWSLPQRRGMKSWISLSQVMKWNNVRILLKVYDYVYVISFRLMFRNTHIIANNK
jgi:hypothetical protein